MIYKQRVFADARTGLFVPKRAPSLNRLGKSGRRAGRRAAGGPGTGRCCWPCLDRGPGPRAPCRGDVHRAWLRGRAARQSLLFPHWRGGSSKRAEAGKGPRWDALVQVRVSRTVSRASNRHLDPGVFLKLEYSPQILVPGREPGGTASIRHARARQLQ